MKNRLKLYFDKPVHRNDDLATLRELNRLKALVEKLRDENIWLVRQLAELRAAA